MPSSPFGRSRLWLFASLMLGLTACSQEQPPAGNAGIPEVEVYITQTATIPVEVSVPGRLEAYRQAEVRARVAGIVTERLYQEGQEVKKGTPLFLINPELLTAARDQAAGVLASAEASHRNALDKLERYRDLASDHSVSERDYQAAVAEELQAKAQVLTAKAQLDKANLDLGYAKVTSPIDGRARRALVTEGALVGLDSPTPLTTVEQIDPIYVNFSQPATDVMALQRAIRNGRMKGVAQNSIEVKLLFPDGTEYQHPGKLFFSDLAVDSNTDTVAMRALFRNPERELLPGAYVQVKLKQAENPSSVLVPRDALVRTAESSSVMIVDDHEQVQAVNVEANAMRDGFWVVTSGLKGGERVIVTTPAMMAPGTAIKVRDREPGGKPSSLSTD
ncbi:MULTISPECIES: MexX/AxyX family multidrug efflux RND transporter periplasmic adaptor subunit [Methylobacillus]|uniref:Secretion protein HlyD n=1 Tax=Methylobacillus flagellatus (strain ATCC 51484 / DSM 6875 / VKM B-1610 / KT) TaxID=265072 RepID=Q1H1K8_METFK|nr:MULTISPECIES: MexX/AxyX family multidrug efflux RND transporter periplasmic adaptor subunit [Methylobacillus]ABE49629.1 secretion protein HlyD [Methylobacillus flagellatus KT]MPS49131.1 MexX/AxyX family multidrug efflux RND transporter periplasmic adaptor subunit [Methylobacillus sp.]